MPCVLSKDPCGSQVEHVETGGGPPGERRWWLRAEGDSNEGGGSPDIVWRWSKIIWARCGLCEVESRNTHRVYVVGFWKLEKASSASWCKQTLSTFVWGGLPSSHRHSWALGPTARGKEHGLSTPAWRGILVGGSVHAIQCSSPESWVFLAWATGWVVVSSERLGKRSWLEVRESGGNQVLSLAEVWDAY